MKKKTLVIIFSVLVVLSCLLALTIRPVKATTSTYYLQTDVYTFFHI